MTRTLDDFAGVWTLTRRIEDHLTCTMSQFDGLARLTPCDGGLSYAEEGILLMPGQPPIRAERRYLWIKKDAEVAVFFEDGRPFHSFLPDADTAKAAHWCDPDQYDVSYDFGAWPQWSCAWRVGGPRKNYTLISRFAPAP